MSSSLGSSDPPSAIRAASRGWRDPRLWVGVAIIAVSVIAGARLMAAADDSVTVWAVSSDMGAGDTVTPEDLVARQVRFEDPGQLDTYFAAADELPPDLTLRRGVGGGELLPRAAVGTATEAESLHLPVAVEAALVPPSVRSGSVVDVYLTGRSEGEAVAVRPGGRAVLSEVTVVEAPALDQGFAVTGMRQLVLAVGEADASRFFRSVSGLDAPSLTVVRRG